MTNILNWEIDQKIANSYAEACADSVSDESFLNFKKDFRYRHILEGGTKITFDYFLNKIKSLPNKNLFFNNLEKFRKNDLYGNPDLYLDDEVGEFSLTTLKYVYNALEIIDFLKGYSPKKIVEIGGGYGGLSIILNELLEFDSYILIDLPEACKLVDKYISKYGNLNQKVKSLSCFDIDDFDFFNTDLTIAINSLSECNLDSQIKYFNDVVSKSNYSYIVRNLFSQKCFDDHKKTIDSLPEEFLYDDTNKVEETYSQNIIVYIKKND
jgi:putative sugar O-methyltransferase